MNYTITAPTKEELTKKGFTNRIILNKDLKTEEFLAYGFSNHNEPNLYYSKMVAPEISFSLTVDKKTKQIKNIDVLDENFLQPFDYQSILLKDNSHKFAREVFDKVNEVLNRLQKDGIISGYQRGMYV